MNILLRRIIRLLDDEFQEPWIRYVVIACALVLASWLIPKTIEGIRILAQL